MGNKLYEPMRWEGQKNGNEHYPRDFKGCGDLPVAFSDDIPLQQIGRFLVPQHIFEELESWQQSARQPVRRGKPFNEAQEYALTGTPIAVNSDSRSWQYFSLPDLGQQSFGLLPGSEYVILQAYLFGIRKKIHRTVFYIIHVRMAKLYSRRLYSERFE